MSEVETVLLDLDGTLVDSVFVHTCAWKRAFAEVGIDAASHRIHRAIGMGGDRLVTHVAGEAAESSLGDEVRRRHGEHVDEWFDLITPTDGAGELLESLRDRGLTVVLASSADKRLSERLLDLLGDASGHLHASVAGEDAEQSKPAPDLVDSALAAVEASSAVLVGDAVWDVEAAGRAGVPCLGLLTGGFGEAELREAGARDVFDSPRDLLEHLDRALLAG